MRSAVVGFTALVVLAYVVAFFSRPPDPAGPVQPRDSTSASIVFTPRMGRQWLRQEPGQGAPIVLRDPQADQASSSDGK